MFCRSFLSLIFVGVLSLPLSTSHTLPPNLVKELVTYGFSYAAGTKLKLGKLKNGARLVLLEVSESLVSGTFSRVYRGISPASVIQ